MMCFLRKFLLLLATLEKSYINLILKALRDKLLPLLRFRSFAESSVNVAGNDKVKKITVVCNIFFFSFV